MVALALTVPAVNGHHGLLLDDQLLHSTERSVFCDIFLCSYWFKMINFSHFCLLEKSKIVNPDCGLVHNTFQYQCSARGLVQIKFMIFGFSSTGPIRPRSYPCSCYHPFPHWVWGAGYGRATILISRSIHGDIQARFA